MIPPHNQCQISDQVLINKGRLKSSQSLYERTWNIRSVSQPGFVYRYRHKRHGSCYNLDTAPALVQGCICSRFILIRFRLPERLRDRRRTSWKGYPPNFNWSRGAPAHHRIVCCMDIRRAHAVHPQPHIQLEYAGALWHPVSIHPGWIGYEEAIGVPQCQGEIFAHPRQLR